MWRKAIGIIAAIVILAGAAGVWYVKSQSFMHTAAALVADKAAETLQTKIKIGAVELHSLTEIRAGQIEVYDKEGRPLLTAEEVRVHFRPLDMLGNEPGLRGVGSVEVENARAFLARDEDGNWNYRDLLPDDAQDSTAFGGKVILRGGVLELSAATRRLVLEEVAGTVDFAAQPSMAFELSFVNQDGRAEVSGAVGGSRDAVSVKAENFRIENYRELLPEDMAIKIEGGLLKTASVTFLREKGVVTARGETTLLDVSLDIEGTKIEKIDGLMLFNEDDLRIFSRGYIEEQPVVLRGTMTMDLDDPLLDMRIDSSGFDLSSVLPAFPLRGKAAITANVRGRYENPTIQGKFSLPEGDICGYALHDLAAELQFSGDMVHIAALTGSLGGGSFSGEGNIAVKDLSYQLRVRAAALPAAEFAEYLPEVAGAVDGDIMIDGQGADAAVYGSAAVSGGSYRGLYFERADASFFHRGGRTVLDALHIAFPQGEVAAEGTVEGERMDLRFYGSQLDLSLLARLEPALKIGGQADFSGRVFGTFDQPMVQAAVKAERGVLFAQPYQTASGTFSLAGGKVATDDFVLQDGATRHDVSGFVFVSGEKTVRMKVVTIGARAENLLKAAFPYEALTGNVDNVLQISGSLENPQVDGSLDFYDGSFRRVLLKKAGGNYRWKDGRLELENFYVSAPNLQVNLDGKMTPDGALDFDIAAEQINFGKLRLNLPYPVAGIGAFAGKLTGTTDAPAFDGRLTANQLTLNGRELRAIDGVVTYRGQKLKLESFGFEQGNGIFQMTGNLRLDTKRMQGKLSVEHGDIAAILALFNMENQWINGELDGAIDLGGTTDTPHVRMVGFMGEGTLKKDYPLSHIALDVALDGKVVTVHQFRAQQGDGMLVAEGRADMEGALDMEIAGSKIDAGLITSLANYQVDTKGTLDFAAHLGGTAQRPEGNLSLEIQGGGIASATFDSLYGLFVLRDGVIHIDQILARQGEYKASAYGSVPLAVLDETVENLDVRNQMNLKILLDHADLSILPFLTKEVEWAVGETKGGVTVTGSLKKPLVHGGVQVVNGAVKFKALGNPLQNLAFDLQFTGDQLHLNEFSGTMGSGSYQMSGMSRIDEAGFSGYDFNLRLDKLDIVNKYYTGPLEGTLQLTEDHAYKRAAPKLTGSLNFEHCTADIPSFPETDAALPYLRLDLELLLGDKVRLYNSFLYDIWLEGHANFSGSTLHPEASGEITALRGTVNYLKTPFDIKEASAYFNQVGSFLPSLRLEADTRLQRAKVYLRIDGPADAMNIRLTSDPEMNESEILSLLTLRSRYYDKSDSGIGKDEMVSLLDMGLQMSFLSEVEEMMRDALNLDEFRVVRDTIDSGMGRSSGEEVYNVEIGKYINDKLMLRYTQGVDYDSYKYGFRYDFNSRITLMGDMDEDNDMMIGLEARFKF